MTQSEHTLPPFLAEPSKLGSEISVTGKWTPQKRRGLIRRSGESQQMRETLGSLHADATRDDGVLSTEIDHAVGEDAVLVHQVFESPEALAHFHSTTAAPHTDALTTVAEPGMHLIRGLKTPTPAREALLARDIPAVCGEFLFGYVKGDYQLPDVATAIQVTAKWTCKPRAAATIENLSQWWQRVGTEAHSTESGLLRFEAYRVIGEDALIIHETFRDTAELKFHLSKGTAHTYKKDIDEIATPDAYFFRGPVSWMIRTYSKFLRLPATYSTRAISFTRPGGSMSDGTTA